MSKQYYKSLYFSDFPSEGTKDKTTTVAFGESEISEFKLIKELTTAELKDLMGIHSYKKISDLAIKEERSINQTIKRLIKKKLSSLSEPLNMKNEVTFSSSKTIPFQRWYPYIEGYSPVFVRSLIDEYKIDTELVYEPFAGTGTTMFACSSRSIKSIYSEVNPLLQFIIETKVSVLNSPIESRIKLAEKLIYHSENIINHSEIIEKDHALESSYYRVFSSSKYFPEQTFLKLLKLRTYIDKLKDFNDLESSLVMIAVLSTLLPVSFLKKAGDVRFKTEKEVKNELKTFEDILPKKLNEIAEDILNFDYTLDVIPQLILSNAKDIGKTNDLTISSIITSPPYLNGTNYFRNTKIELWFLKYLRTENDLRFFRDQALTSGINDVKKEYESSSDVEISSMSSLLKLTLSQLEVTAYDCRIPLMAKSYFQEMYVLFKDVRKHLKQNSKILIDIGDSIFAGTHIKTDLILIELLQTLGYNLIENKLLRKRKSRNQAILSQNLIAFEFSGLASALTARKKQLYWTKNWKIFKALVPHQQEPFSKRNWGHNNHSLCSYQGKLKPAIAHHLVETFVPKNGSVLDPFSGVGTIPFEAALSGKTAYGLDISLPAYYISTAKVSQIDISESDYYISKMADFIACRNIDNGELEIIKKFGFNKKLYEYYHEDTFREIILAREFIKQYPPTSPSEMLVIACLLHVLHGNRPYALSRKSHPIVPYAPSGEFIYKSLIQAVIDKVNRSFQHVLPEHFCNGRIFHQDTTHFWPQEINNLDAIITSPPFFDSTRFYLANWIRIWFSGWSEADFKIKPKSFIEEKQKLDFNIYNSIFRQSKERLKKDGVLVLHLGKSSKCDMANELVKVSKKWFKKIDLFDENVEHCESHGITDKGTVTSHQYLVLS